MNGQDRTPAGRRRRAYRDVFTASLDRSYPIPHPPCYHSAMCGRYALSSSTPRLARLLGLETGSGQDTDPSFEPSYNIAPTQQLPVCRMDRHRRRELRMMRWGLIPSWSKGDSSKFSMINARSETLTERPAYRTPFRFRRCLVPADGFYEWKREGNRKQPYFIGLRSKQPFAFAGLWERWKGSSGERIDSYAIITTTANDFLKSIHERMPVILDEAHFTRWLDPTLTDPAELTPLLGPYSDLEMRAYPVSTFVNKPQNNDARCSQPLAPEAAPVPE